MAPRNANTDRDVQARDTNKVRQSASLGDLMEPNGTAAPMASNANAPAADLGGLVAGPQQPQEAPTQDNAEFQSRVTRNKGFLSDPGVQAGLLQFALNMMSPGGDFANAVGSGFEAVGRVATNRDEQALIDRKMAQEDRQISQGDRRLDIDEAELGIKAQGATQKADALMRRQLLFKKAGTQGEGMPSMGEQELLDLAGELMADGDDDGAKVAVDMANSKRMMYSTDDIREYQYYRQQGGLMPFKSWQDDKITKGVPKPPPAPTASMDPKLIEAGIKIDESVDKLQSGLPDYEMLLDTVRQADTGKMVPLTLPIRQAMKQLGFQWGDDVDQVPLLEQLQAQQNRLALKLRSPAEGMGLPGAASDQDLVFLKQAGPGLATSPQANEAMAIIMLAKARREVEVEKEKSKYIWANGTLKGWQGYKDEFIKDRSMFTPDEQAILDRASNVEKNAPGQVQAVPKNDTTPQAPPDNLGLTEEQKSLWPHLTVDQKNEIMGVPPKAPVQ